MKRTLRKIVPIVLVILVLASLVWYLFVYDRDLTRDLLLQQARYFDSKGDHSTATWLYNAAYSHSENNEDVAIELAEQFQSVGNYVKAESTLANAISDGASSKLYVALCKTYVAQNKLLDAVNMLENVSDPAIKAELEAMRPAAPAATPKDGFYSQYISVSFEETDATLYVSTDGEYPSTADTPYSEPIPLSSGETLIYAIAVSKDGLVSPLSVLGYTVGGVVEEVEFADSAVESAVRTQLELDESTAVLTSDLWTITEFTVPAEAESSADLGLMTYLRKLTVESPAFSEFDFLSSLGQLEELTISDCVLPVSSLEVIASLPNLTKLALPQCSLSSIAALEKAAKLTYLDLSSNSVRDISALSAITSLQELYLSHNALTTLDALSTLTNLTTLDVSYNSILNTAPLASCGSLQNLNISTNGLMNMEGLDKLTGLSSLTASSNQFVAVDELAACTALTYLDISSNTILDIASLSVLTKLESFYFSNNEISALPQWPSDLPLIRIDGSYNDLKDLEALRGLQQLNYVFMDHNEKLSSVAPLEECPMLVQVNVFGTKVRDVSGLTESSVIVNYDPT